MLQRLLVDDGEAYDVVALTGTSGGALCAFLTWYGLRAGDAGKATGLLGVLERPGGDASSGAPSQR